MDMKTAFIYMFPKDFDIMALINTVKVEIQTKKNKFTPCSGSQLTSEGWVNPIDKQSATLFFEGASNILAANLLTETKIIPSDIIDDELEARIHKIENTTNQPLTKIQKDEIKTQVITELSKQAFTKKKNSGIIIIPNHRLLISTATSIKAAERSIAKLRKMAGSLPVTTFGLKSVDQSGNENKVELNSLFDDILLSNSNLVGMTLGGDITFKSKNQSKGSIVAKSEDYDAEEIKNLLTNRTVVKLSMTKESVGSLTIDEDFYMKSIKLENNPEADQDTDIFTKFDTNLILFVNFILDTIGAISETAIFKETEDKLETSI